MTVATAEIKTAFGAAMAAHQAGRLGEAESIYRNILAASPDHADSLHLLGLIASQRGNPAAALDLIGRAIALSPGKPIAHYHNNMAMALLALNRPDGAIDQLKAALALTPDDAEGHYNLGVLLNERGRPAEAMACFQRAVTLRPDSPEALANLGGLYQAEEKLDEAESCYRRSLALDPASADAQYNLGCVLQKQGNREGAAVHYRRAMAAQPNHLEAGYNLGVALQEQGYPAEAAACFRQVLERNPAYPRAHFGMHSVHLRPEDPEPAIQSLRRAVESAPQDMGYRFFLGMLLDYGGDAEAARVQLELAARGPGAVRAWVDSWRYLKSAGRGAPRLVGSYAQAFRLAFDAAPASGLVLEFGVCFGTTIRQIAAVANQPVHGFDSFEGLPESWYHEPAGRYSTHGILPKVPENVTLHKGWFTDTLPAFLAAHPGPVRFVNIDCDLYSSTKQILDLLADRIVPGTVMAFDEYLGTENWREDEFKAFQEAVQTHGWKYEYLSLTSIKQVVLRLL